MDRLIKLKLQDHSKANVLHSASNKVKVNFAEQCRKNLAAPERMNFAKGEKKHAKREATATFTERFYTVVDGDEFQFANVKMGWQKGHFPELDIAPGKKAFHGGHGVLTHYHF